MEKRNPHVKNDSGKSFSSRDAKSRNWCCFRTVRTSGKCHRLCAPLLLMVFLSFFGGTMC